MEQEVAGELENRQKARDCLSALLEEELSKEERKYAKRERERSFIDNQQVTEGR